MLGITETHWERSRQGRLASEKILLIMKMKEPYTLFSKELIRLKTCNFKITEAPFKGKRLQWISYMATHSPIMKVKLINAFYDRLTYPRENPGKYLIFLTGKLNAKVGIGNTRYGLIIGRYGL